MSRILQPNWPANRDEMFRNNDVSQCRAYRHVWRHAEWDVLSWVLLSFGMYWCIDPGCFITWSFCTGTFWTGHTVLYCRSFKTSTATAISFSHLQSQAIFCLRHYSILIISLWLEIGRELWVQIVPCASACSDLWLAENLGINWDESMDEETWKTPTP